MLTAPGSITRIANSEAASISLDVDSTLDGVRLVPRFGEERVLPLSEGAFEFPMMEEPNSVKLEWLQGGTKAFTSNVEVVSRHYFKLDALKGYGDGQDDFDELPDEELFQARQAATEVFEQNANRSFVHRIGRTKDYGKQPVFYLEHNDVYELLTEGYRLVSDCQIEPDGTMAVPFPVWVEYLYGTDNVPAQVSRAVLELAAYMLRPTNRPVGATGESTDAGYIHFTTAGRDGATDIPEVNAAIEQFGRGVRYVW